MATPRNNEHESLKALYVSDSRAQIILDHFGGRTNSQSVTKVDQIITRLRSTADLPRWSVVKFFRDLERFGYGRFIEGRRGHPSRFEWSSNPVEVGKAAASKENLPISGVALKEEDDEEDQLESDFVAHPFNLRPGLTVTLTLPSDLSDKEAERIAGFVRTLPL